MKSPSLTPLGLDIEPHRAELAALLNLLSVGQGVFSLSVAVCNAPILRDRLIDEVRRQFPTVQVLSIPAETFDIYGFVRDKVKATKISGLFLIGLEASISDSRRDQRTLRSLNASRDLWPNCFPMPVVFWMPEYAARALSETARDFWRIRSHRFSFLFGEKVSTIRVSDANYGLNSVGSLHEFEKLARIEELERRLAHMNEPASQLRPHSLAWLAELSELHRVLGNLNFAEEMAQRALDICGRERETPQTAAAFGSLGLIYQAQGKPEQAEEMFQKSLAIDQKLGLQDEIAADYGNLGVACLMRNDLDSAEIMIKKALALQEQLDLREYAANQYGNLGLIYLRRGDLVQAEEMLQKASAVYRELDLQDGLARQYGNLGLIYRQRGDLDKAEELHRKAMDINEMLGNQEGLAIQCANLGAIAENRGELTRARELWTKARDLYAKIGMPHEVERVQGWLDELPTEAGM